MQHRKINWFWRIYGVVAVFVAALLVLGLIIFYNFIGAYETSQPQNAADKYLSGLTEDDVIGMIDSSFAAIENPLENTDAFVDVYRNAWRENTAICQKDLLSGTTDKPVFAVMCGEVEMLRITLEKVVDGSFGFENWDVVSVKPSIDSVIKNAKNYSVYVPDGAKLTVNDKDIDIQGVAPAMCPLISNLEPEHEQLYYRYDLGRFYGEPSVSCKSGDAECVFVNKNGTLIYALPGSEIKDYTITVPSDATVEVDGLVLDGSYTTGQSVPYEYSVYEKDTAGLPSQTVYSTGVLFHEPVVKIMYNDEELPVDKSEGSITAAFPKKHMYSVTVKVPEGASVSLNGKSVTETPVKENAFDELGIDSTGAASVYDVYTIDGLYAAVNDVVATANGEEVTFFSGTTENEEGYSQIFSATGSSVLDENVANYAMDYIKAYFHYAYQGYKNTEANLNAALAYIQRGTELYSDVEKSLIGFQFQSPVTSLEYKQFDVTDMTAFGDGSYAVKVVYDVVETYSNIVRTRAGEISLHIVNDGGNLKISSMVIDKK